MLPLNISECRILSLDFCCRAAVVFEKRSKHSRTGLQVLCAVPSAVRRRCRHITKHPRYKLQKPTGWSQCVFPLCRAKEKRSAMCNRKDHRATVKYQNVGSRNHAIRALDASAIYDSGSELGDPWLTTPNEQKRLLNMVNLHGPWVHGGPDFFHAIRIKKAPLYTKPLTVSSNVDS